MNKNFANLEILPDFIRFNPLAKAEWCDISSFLKILTKNSITKFKKAIEHKEFNDPEFNIEISLINQSTEKMNFKLYFNPLNEETILLTLKWSEKDANVKSLFAKTSENTRNLIKNDYKYILFIKLHSKQLMQDNSIIDLVTQHIPSNLSVYMDFIRDEDKLFFTVPDNLPTNGSIKIMLEDVLKSLKTAIKYVNFAAVFNKDLCDRITNKNLDIILNYLYFLKNNKIDVNFKTFNNNLINTDAFKNFYKQYSRGIKAIEKGEIEIESTSLKTLGNSTSNLKILSPVFKDKELDQQLRLSMAGLDLFWYLDQEFINKLKTSYKIQNAFLVIEDYNFIKTDLSAIKTLIEDSKNLIQIIKLNNMSNNDLIFKRLDLLSVSGENVGVHIKTIDEDVIQTINKNNIKYIIFDKEIATNLDNPKNLMLLSTLINMLKDKKPLLIFEKLDITNHKRILQEKYNKILYTK
nr:hypothetical protein [[Mycoplasma] anseris]